MFHHTFALWSRDINIAVRYYQLQLFVSVILQVLYTHFCDVMRTRGFTMASHYNIKSVSSACNYILTRRNYILTILNSKLRYLHLYYD